MYDISASINTGYGIFHLLHLTGITIEMAMKPKRPVLFFLLLTIVIGMSALHAQQTDSGNRPFLVPFRADGKWGLMDTLGREVKAPGFCKSIIVREDFSYYVITDNSETPRHWIISPQSGKRIGPGTLKSPDPALKIGDTWFYHFEEGNKSVLASPVTQESFALDGRYKRIQSAELYDLEGKNKKSYLIAFDDNDIGYIISVADDFRKAPQVPAFKEIELISAGAGKRNPRLKKRSSGLFTRTLRKAFPIGFAVQTTKIEEVTGDEQAHIYDFQLDKIGEMPVSDSALSAAFGAEAGLNSSMLIVSAAGGGITGNGSAKDENIKLNKEFAIKRLDKPLSYDAFRRVFYLIQKRRGQSYRELVSDEIARFDWVPYNGEKLITIWFQRGDNHLKAFFDYNGVILPRNKLMVPSKYYHGEEMQPFLFR